MSDSCRCFDVRARVVMDEPKLSGKLDFSGEIILCSDGEDYKRGYEEGHAKGLADGQKVGYENGYNEGQIDGHKSGYEAGKTEGLTEGYDNGYEKGKTDGYKDGYEEGYSKGYEQGLIDGAKEEQEKSILITENCTIEILPDDNKVLSKVKVEVDVADNFRTLYWNEFQQNGERVDYDNACAKFAFTEKTFYPIHDIRPTTADKIFQSSRMKISLPQRLEECDIVLDFSNCGGTPRNAFSYSYFTELPECDFSNRSSIQDAFNSMEYLRTIEKIVVSKTTQNWWNTFLNCAELVHVIFEGIIVVGVVNINLKVCPLDSESAISAILCLEDVLNTENAYVKAVIFSPTTWAYLDALGNDSPNGNTWREYINDLGWNAS